MGTSGLGLFISPLKILSWRGEERGAISLSGSCAPTLLSKKRKALD